MSKLSAAARWICALVAAGVAIAIGFLTYGGRKLKEGVSTGAAKQKARDDLEDLNRAEETGDDEGVLNEWRKHR